MSPDPLSGGGDGSYSWLPITIASYGFSTLCSIYARTIIIIIITHIDREYPQKSKIKNRVFHLKAIAHYPNLP